MSKKYYQVASLLKALCAAVLGVIVLSIILSACSISEEIKRIDAVRKAEQRQEAANSGDLTGEQIFIRTCNTCHPGGKEGLGPALDKLSDHFPNDQALKNFIRAGNGIMPAQSVSAINDQEMNNLIIYLRSLQ